jgi:hypothetical protein
MLYTMLDPGRTGEPSPSHPQVNTMRRGGTRATNRPEAHPSPRTFIQNTPPGLGSISAVTPCQDSHRSRSVKKENTVAGLALMCR